MRPTERHRGRSLQGGAVEIGKLFFVGPLRARTAPDLASSCRHSSLNPTVNATIWPNGTEGDKGHKE